MTDVAVRALAPALAGDFLHFFDHERGAAFADNPGWAKCYCHFYEVPMAVEWASLTAAQNRLAMRARIEVGEMEGFLAFVDGEPVGWLNAQPRHKLPHCFDRMRIAATPLPCATYQAAVIVCFIIAPAWRRRGVASALLASAISSLAARGFVLVDAFPFKAGDGATAADHYHGALSMFTAAGFAPLAESDTITVVRRFLR
jgi:GNAT superfamily N-acetyltransferase